MNVSGEELISKHDAAELDAEMDDPQHLALAKLSPFARRTPREAVDAPFGSRPSCTLARPRIWWGMRYMSPSLRARPVSEGGAAPRDLAVLSGFIVTSECKVSRVTSPVTLTRLNVKGRAAPKGDSPLIAMLMAK
jgi:hypothetical protein